MSSAEFLDNPWLLGGLIILVAYPTLIVVLSEVGQRLERKSHPLGQAIGHVRNVTVPLALVLLFLHVVLDIKESNTFLKIVFTALLFSVVYAAITGANIFFFTKADAGSWRARVPKLFLDLSRALVVGAGFVTIVSVVWQSDLGKLVTALGVSTIVVGLALQDTLGNFFAGMAILFDRPFVVGEVIQVGHQEGKVVGITWRSVRLLIKGNDSILVIPNNVLGKEMVLNLSRPSMYTERIIFRSSPKNPPNTVKRMLEEVAVIIPGVLADPAPEISIHEETDAAILYEVSLALESCEDRHRVRDTFMSRAWYAAERHGLSEPSLSDNRLKTAFPFEATAHATFVKNLVSELDKFSVLGALSPSDKKDLADNCSVLRFAAGEIVVHEGDQRAALYLIARGEAVLSTLDAGQKKRDVLRLAPGELVGIDEVVLGLPSAGTLTAVSDMIVVYAPREVASDLFDRVPRLSRDLGEVMELRRRAIALARQAGSPQLLA